MFVLTASRVNKSFFIGGIILVTGLVHILTEGIQLCLKIGVDIRLANTLCVAGICIPFFLEKGGLLVWVIRHPYGAHGKLIHSPSHHGHSHSPPYHPTLLSEPAPASNYSTIPQLPSETPASLKNGKTHSNLQHPPLGQDLQYGDMRSSDVETEAKMPRFVHSHSHPDLFVPEYDEEKETYAESCRERSCSLGEQETTCVVPSITSVKLQNRVDILRSMSGRKAEDGLLVHADMIVSDDCGAEAKLQLHNHLDFASNVLLVVLSIHSIIAGLTLSSLFDAQTLSGLAPVMAFSMHKFFESLALSTTFFKREHPRLTRLDWFKISVYVCATPLGVVVGNSVEFHGFGKLVLLSVTSGNFVYIALVEIIGEEFQSEQSRVTKFCCYLAGIVTACAINWMSEG